MFRNARLTSRILFFAFLFACTSSNGSSSSECTEGLTRCGSACVDLEVDGEHCGGCDQACATGQTCEFGSCADDPCPDGRNMCAGRCVDLRSNVLNCGGCGEACADGEVCLEGSCSQSCEAGQDVCEGSCVDRQNDASHCGACGNRCADGALCSRGKCAESCDDGLIPCGSSCVDDRSDRMHCGGCRQACDVGLVCIGGFCSCPVGQIDCNGTCLDASADPLNCGGCGDLCPSEGLPNASSAHCADSTCKLQCNFGRGNCNARAADGCEVDVLNDPANCGACGVDCEAGLHVSGARCSSGGCLITLCDHGWWDANGDHEDGCEVNTLEHPEHCGVGGNQSSRVDCTRIANAHGGDCVDGVCDYVCDAGWDDCDKSAVNGCEVDLQSDMSHCGACNNACDPGGACVDGACLPDTEVPNWPLPPESPVDYTVADFSVTDNVTGLVWERQPLDSTHAWQDAGTYCNRLSQEGKKWRLPTAAELLTIVDTTRQSPAINTSDLRNTASAQYWTATSTPAGTTAWFVNFSSGASGVIAKTSAYRVRCVRGGKNERGLRYSVSSGGETVTDNKTGLMWEREPIGTTFTWVNAPGNCSSAGIGGFSDWRLPTKKELESLVERRKAQPMIDADAFPKVPNKIFWTRTEVQGSSTNAWRVSFVDGTSASASRTTAYNVICVRKS